MPATTTFDVDWVTLLQGRRDEYPTLARASLDTRRANNPRIEWLVDTLTDGKTDEPRHSVGIWHNYCQIFRTKKKTSPDLSQQEARRESADEMLRMIEKCLVDGIPYREFSGPHPITWLGGCKHYLGRPLNDNDILRLRPLRNPFTRLLDRDEVGIPYDHPIVEWICEISLEVIPQAP